MAEQTSSRNVSAKDAVECVRGSMSNAELMGKFKISAQGYADLLRQLFEKRLISEEDLARRGIRFKVMKRDAAPVQSELPPEELEEPDAEELLKAEELDAVAEPQPSGPIPVTMRATDDEEEGFLDTQELTDLLSFTPPAPPKAKASAAPPQEPEPEIEKEEDTTGKKSRFSLSGLFRKTS
jgi:hypothetical protein